MTEMWGGVRVGGPLAPFAVGVGNALLGDGYSRLQARELVRLAAELSDWLEATGRDMGELNVSAVAEFFASRDRSRERFRTAHSLAPIMDRLRALGALPAAPKVTVGRTDAEVELLDSHWRWCVAQRGISVLTADQYRRRVSAFLELWRPKVPGDIGDLDGTAVLATVTIAAGVMPAPSLRCMVTALRSFLRFLHATGRTRCSLLTAVPPLRSWPRTALPNVLSDDAVRQLVIACDPTEPAGSRDRAVILLLLRLGLRSIEISRLTLDDVGWREGGIRVRGKGGRVDLLPLPVEVGEAIVAYLRGGRPPSRCRALFLTVAAPIRPLSHDAVGSLVYRACERAGVPRVGPHALRRTLATATLRAGAPMAEVAQLLRHADQATTSIYAAADAAAVAALAQPWPEVRS